MHQAQESARRRLQEEQARFEQRLSAQKTEQVRDLTRKHEFLMGGLKEQSAEEERALKAQRDQELRAIETGRRERSWQIETMKQQEEKRLEEEYKKQMKLQNERFQLVSAKQEEESAMKKWKLREQEKLAKKELEEDSKRKREELTGWREREEEDITVSSDWRRYAADKTSQVITETSGIKIGAIGRMEEKRLDVAISADERRMKLYINAIQSNKDLTEGELKELDDILLDPTVFKNHSEDAIHSQIEMSRPMLSITSSNSQHNEGTSSVKDGLMAAGGTQEERWSQGGRSLRDQLEHRKQKVEKRCDKIITNTSRKVADIEESEIARLESLSKTDKRSCRLLNKVVSRGDFEPKFVAQLNQELTPMESGLKSKEAIQEVVNVGYNDGDDTSSEEEDYTSSEEEEDSNQSYFSTNCCIA